MKLKLTLEYEGSYFSGWQRQADDHISDRPSIQHTFSKALQVILISLAKRQGLCLNPEIQITASGRTDAGVHAKGQVVSFPWPKELDFEAKIFVRSLNGILPKQISILHAEGMEDSFDARFSPHFKWYNYYILNRSSPSALYPHKHWHIIKPLEVGEMIKASSLLAGTRDFSSFCASDCGSKTKVRTLVSSELIRNSSGYLVYQTCGRGFLKQMIRIIVGTIVDVGLGKLKGDDILSIIAAKDRKAAGRTAPAAGLFLDRVEYL